MTDNGEFPYIWRWGPQMDIPTMDHPMRGRKGKSCRVLARGKRNSAMIEFEDGFRAVVSRNGLAKRNPEDKQRGVRSREQKARYTTKTEQDKAK